MNREKLPDGVERTDSAKALLQDARRRRASETGKFDKHAISRVSRHLFDITD